MVTSDLGCIPTDFEELMWVLLWNLSTYDETEIKSVSAEYGRKAPNRDPDCAKAARITITPKQHKELVPSRILQNCLKAPIAGEISVANSDDTYYLFAELVYGAVSDVEQEENVHTNPPSVLFTIRTFYRSRSEVEARITKRALDEAHYFHFEQGKVTIVLYGNKSDRKAEEAWAQEATRSFGILPYKDWLRISVEFSYANN